MSLADRLNRWNRWYDDTPEHWRSHILLWPLVLAGFINMQLTIASGFPFGLLVLLALLAIAAVRVPYVRGWIKPDGDSSRLEIGQADWIYSLNRRYDDMPEARRLLVIPAILIVVGAVNMWLTLSYNFTFGGLFLLGMLAILLVRAPYQWGLITAPSSLPRGPLVSAWIYDLNLWYDDLPKDRRFWTAVGTLALVVLIDLRLTAGHGVWLTLALLVEFLVLIGLRAPYVSGTLTAPVRGELLRLQPETRQIEHAAVPALRLHAAEPVRVSHNEPAAPTLAGSPQDA